MVHVYLAADQDEYLCSLGLSCYCKVVVVVKLTRSGKKSVNPAGRGATVF